MGELLEGLVLVYTTNTEPKVKLRYDTTILRHGYRQREGGRETYIINCLHPLRFTTYLWSQAALHALRQRPALGQQASHLVGHTLAYQLIPQFDFKWRAISAGLTTYAESTRAAELPPW